MFNQEAQTRKYAQTSEVAKANLDATIREMQAGQNTVSAAAIATSVSDPKQRAKIANDLGQLTAKLQDLNRELVVEGERKSSADSVIQGQIAEMYDKNLKIRETDVQTAIEKAGGIDDNGTLKVRAKAKSNIIKLYMENVDAVGTIYSSEGYTPQEQLDVIEKNVLRGGEEPASEMHVYAALKRTLLTNGNNWSAQKILDFAATRGMKYDEETKKFQAYDTNGNLYDLSEEEVRSRRDFQQMVKEYIDKSPLKVDYMSATQRSLLETGTFIAPPGKTASEQSILFDTKIGKYDEARIVSADVDVLQRMVQVFRDPDNRTADNREAREKLLARILAAQTNPQVNASIKDRERGVMNALASYLDDSDTRSGAEKEGVMYYVRDESGNKTNAYIDSTGALRRVTADTPGAESESISVKAPDVYDITKMQAP